MSLDAETGRIVGDPARHRPSETVSGYLAAIAIFVSFLGIFWHPLRLILPALALSLVASAMAGPDRRLQLASVLIGAVCFVLGMALAVATSHALW